MASYRQTVLTALQEVEDNLAAVRWLEQEQAAQRKAADAAAETLVIAQNQYLAGTVSYLNVVTAQSASLGAAQNYGTANSLGNLFQGTGQIYTAEQTAAANRQAQANPIGSIYAASPFGTGGSKG